MVGRRHNASCSARASPPAASAYHAIQILVAWFVAFVLAVVTASGIWFILSELT
jgi:hypothetical protein